MDSFVSCARLRRNGKALPHRIVTDEDASMSRSAPGSSAVKSIAYACFPNAVSRIDDRGDADR
jgi:hypothetical protein